MTCKYNFKGIAFNTEEELNDFLLNRLSNSALNDVVYLRSKIQENIHTRLNNLSLEYKDLLKDSGFQVKTILEAEEVEPEELDDIGTLKYPYISVTDLIHSLRGRKSDFVFPIFRSDEYWKLKFEMYRNGTFDSYEIQFIDDLIPKDADDNRLQITDTATLNKIRDRIEGEIKKGIREGGLWKLQAICGNLVHEVFARFYRDTVPIKLSDGTYKKGSYLYKLKNSPNEIVDYLYNHVSKEYASYITKSLLESIVTQCILLDKEIRNTYGEDAYIRAEQPIVGDLNFLLDESNKITKIVGKIDLLVVGKNGEIGIIDYKCSPKEYTTSNIANDPNYYNSAKILTFKYQLEVYRRVLEQLGFPRKSGGIQLFVVPLKFEDFKMENGKVSFSGISSMKHSEEDTMLLKLPNSDGGTESVNINSNLDLVFPPKDELYVRTTMEATEIVSKTREVTKQWFSIVLKEKSAADYKERIEKAGGVKLDQQTGQYYYKPNRNNDNGLISVKATSKELALVKILEELKRRDEYNLSYVVNTTNFMRKLFTDFYTQESLENPIMSLLKYASTKSHSKINAEYIRNSLEKYTNTDIWKPVPTDTSDPINSILDLFGIMLFENKNTHAIDVVRVSGLYEPQSKVSLKGNLYILGNYLKDSISHNSSESLTMLSTSGNIELLESMVVLNQLKDMFKDEFSRIGKVRLLCPAQLTGLEVPNEQLLYNFDRLCNLDKNLITNNFKTSSNSNGVIKMATYIDLLKQDFKEILTKSTNDGLNVLEADIKQSVSRFDWNGKTAELLKRALIELDAMLTKLHPEVTQNIQNKLNDSSPQFRLHKDILYAIAELSGVKMVQQIEELKKYDLLLNNIQKLGMSGTMIDNPGTLQSSILNQATNQVTIAYQNTRDSVLKFDEVLKEKVKKLKERKGFNWLSLNLTLNQTTQLYKNMFDDKSSDIRFLNPWDETNSLLPEEREFLKYALIKINSTRGNGLNLEAMLLNPNIMKSLIESNPELYLKCPLVKGDFASEVAMRGGILNFIRDRFKYLSIWNAQTREAIKLKVDDTVTNFLSTEKEYESILKGDLWEAINTMSDLDDPNRLEDREKLINRRGKEYFEHNLETLLLKLHSAYVMAEELNKVFPVILSLLIHLNALGAVLNTKFTNDVLYLLDYIKTKVHNLPMEDRTKQEAKFRDIANEGMKWASRLALAYNIRQTYLFLDGIWLDIKLLIKYPEFTKENLFWAWKYVMSDLFKYGNTRSIPELLNILYGINDMDMNTYIDRIKSDNTGLMTHFWDTGFRFSSRPDYYNRMAIFLALMKNDGSFEAHSIKDGKLVYDWTEDKRFEAFANNSSNKELYNKAKVAYITLARLLIEEGAVNEDGTPFRLDLVHPQALPKAYSNKESEGKKAFSDRIYGYYAHEKKSMLNSTFVGSLMMQMNTYWSAKKNQWIQQTSYTQEGKWVDYEEDGVKYYWKIGENGELEPTKENTGLPIQVWKGLPLEGIIVTVAKLGAALCGRSDVTDKSGIAGVKELLNNPDIDPDLRRLYVANLRLLWYDLFMLLVLGVFCGSLLQSGYKEFSKEHPNDNLSNALANTSLYAGMGIINSSATDFNPIESIFGRGVLWTPFAISSIKNVFTLYKNVAGGSQDFYDAIIKTSAAGRSTMPIWDFVKLNTLGTNVGKQSLE